MPRRKTKRTTSYKSTHTPSSSSSYSYSTNAKGQRSSKATSKSYSPSTTSTTRTSTSETKTGRNFNVKLPSPSGNAQLVLVIGLILFAFAEWGNVVTPLASTIWSGKANNINWRGSLGMLVMILVMVLLSAANDEIAGLMLITEFGMSAVLIIKNPSALNSFFSWFNSSPSTSGSSSGSASKSAAGTGHGGPAAPGQAPSAP